ncbi:hypothetical protein PF005_g23515 [Phytophthora fragariae]|uniref:Uncharacterized protein n=1 Tax=Phytophthora fragariae TaxID=53985 RepID=A0A6A3E1H2_9STRA|nr:hypothetical protein PF003_g38926 [Phytophthora fragariae]KAE8925551.1 hypothetical protein PF009_g24240 [Phytophthora fragariae]KAE8981109.1 hypothetical protein PF011_g22157 [Phytophthora fragariae]KAE9079256.1 hypothetical protein PF007_g23523 [Phytophthora fragariae]KAE9100985.1 hypothetical protein PF006_g22775 [Phytophthora fragariae]
MLAARRVGVVTAPPSTPSSRASPPLSGARPDLQPLYVVPSRFFSKLRDPKALSANARARDNLRLQQRTPDDEDVVFQDTQAKDGATLSEVLEYALGKRVGEAPKAFNAAMAAASKEKQHAAVLRVSEALPGGHYKANPWKFSTALDAAVRLRQKKRVFEILDEVEASEVKDDNIYGRVVGAACITKQHELVCEILDYECFTSSYQVGQT